MSTTYYIGDENLDVTYNYAWIFYKLHDGGLKILHGKTGKQALEILYKFEKELCDGPFGSANRESKEETDYYMCTPHNAYHNAVKPLIEMAKRNTSKRFTCHSIKNRKC